jgi:hypothetical protein
VTSDSITISRRSRFRGALLLAIIADALQIATLPLFIAGAESPAADILDLGVGAYADFPPRWHWEFLPSFLARLVPGIDIVFSGRLQLQTSFGSRSGTPVTIEGGRECIRS